jgi:hypothetical protein
LLAQDSEALDNAHNPGLQAQVDEPFTAGASYFLIGVTHDPSFQQLQQQARVLALFNMQVGHERYAPLQRRQRRLFHGDNEITLMERAAYVGAGLFICGIRETGRGARIFLDADGMASLDQLCHILRNQAHPRFVAPYLFRYSYFHDLLAILDNSALFDSMGR